MSLVQSVVETIEQAAHTHHFRRVKTVWLEIGELSSVEPEAMVFCFDAVARNTIVDGAKLEIVSVPGEAWCPHCARTVPIEDLIAQCPDCGACPLDITDGRQMRIQELEVE
ncbi:hydrogenase maturation nickel metallochaperone HypA [Candidatus Symbiobacter mobilis]|nr:hydrogenase maturation nickel metallochaperone HypA [Candidatus Symbiobacter mobilis]